MNPGAARTSLPIQAGEQIPIPEDFAGQLSVVANNREAHCQAGFADLYLRKTAEEIQAIRLANRVANVGLEAFFENLHPGITEAEVAAAVESAIYCADWPRWNISFPGMGHGAIRVLTAPGLGNSIARPDGVWKTATWF